MLFARGAADTDLTVRGEPAQGAILFAWFLSCAQR
jgi:hypothetical protein